VRAEAKGTTSISTFGRRIPHAVLRQGLAVATIGLGAVLVATLAITVLSPLPLARTLFEVVSAFGTAGLSTGITAQLPPAALEILIGLMFLGRTGPITLATALALRERDVRYRFPEERPIIG
jgi:trk system potassium uptake protein